MNWILTNLSKLLINLGETLRKNEVIAAFNQVRVGGLIIKGDITMVELKEGQKAKVKLNFKTRAGNPAQHQAGTVTFESSNPSAISVTQDPNDETAAEIKGLFGANNDSAVITARADGDPDADQTRDIVSTLSAVCTQGEAVTVEMEVGEVVDDVPAEPQPEPAPEA